MRGEASFTSSVSEPIEETFRALEKQMNNGGRALLALDRDGTLIPIANRPEEAVADAEINSILAALSASPRLVVAIVSARSKAQIMADFPNLNLIYAGNYGMEIDFPSGLEITQKPAIEAVPNLKFVRDELEPLTIPGIDAILEDHGLSVCLHWHAVPVEQRPLVHDKIEQLKKTIPDLTFKTLATSYDILPKFEWDKGRALAQIFDVLDCEQDAGSKLSSFFFFGDSQADEPAFRWVNDKQGVSVKVGSAGGSTNSKMQLPDTQAVRAVLTAMTRVC